MKNSGYTSLLLAITILLTVNNCYAQKDKVLVSDINFQKVSIITIPVKSAKFQSNETKNAKTEYMSMTKSGLVSNSAFASLKKKGHSNTAILATIRQSKMQVFTSNTVNNTEIAEDAQLMLKAIPSLSAAEMITAIRDLYDITTPNLFNIALLTLQDSTRYVPDSKNFTFRCDCIISNTSNASSIQPYRKGTTQYVLRVGYYKKLYPWECFDYWNTGFRSVIQPETNLNEFLRFMRVSQYPLYGGMFSADLADPAINFSVIMGTSAESLTELMECATLSYLAPGTEFCDNEVPFHTSVPYNLDIKYRGTCNHPSTIKTRFYLTDVLNVLKRNGFSVTTLATAAKTRFNPHDEDMRKKIIASFDTTVFSTPEILQITSIINSN